MLSVAFLVLPDYLLLSELLMYNSQVLKGGPSCYITLTIVRPLR